MKEIFVLVLTVLNIYFLFKVPGEHKNHNLAVRSKELLTQYEAIEKMQKEIPDLTRLTELIAELPNLVRSHGLKLSSIKYEPLANVAGAYKRLTISLPLEGSYINLRRFIFSLETKSWTAIEKLTLRKGNKANEVSAELQLASYIREN